MNKINYQKQLDAVLAQQQAAGEVPSLLLHACCAPCSSYVLEYLSEYFSITVFFYNPNITERKEYEKRAAEEKRMIREMKVRHPISVLEGCYEPERFLKLSEGYETVPEGGIRCRRCFELRLGETARLAHDMRFDWFTTSLTISPLKNAELLNQVGQQAAEKYGARFLPSDFKKRNGYKRSVELSAQYHLYRQNYCGCSFSKQEAEEREARHSSGRTKTAETAESSK
jgi:predicted adenine nucleotide alpha hydrolase (AANH) superfamily ATPase